MCWQWRWSGKAFNTEVAESTEGTENEVSAQDNSSCL